MRNGKKAWSGLRRALGGAPSQLSPGEQGLAENYDLAPPPGGAMEQAAYLRAREGKARGSFLLPGVGQGITVFAASS